jgi:hypothetical protein
MNAQPINDELEKELRATFEVIETAILNICQGFDLAVTAIMLWLKPLADELFEE